MITIFESENKLRETFGSIVSARASEAVKDAVGYGHDRISISGNEIETINEIRDWFFLRGYCRDFANGFLITAPHTHWNPSKPIIISMIDDHYKIGNQIVDRSKAYRPVSFLFSGNDIVPYEWIDETVHIAHCEYEAALAAVIEMPELFNRTGSKLGIGLNFRFRELFSVENSSSIESTGELSLYKGFGTIRRITEAALQVDFVEYEQVYWHCISIKYSDLSPETSAILAKIEIKIINITDPALREAVVQRIIKM